MIHQSSTNEDVGVSLLFKKDSHHTVHRSLPSLLGRHHDSSTSRGEVDFIVLNDLCNTTSTVNPGKNQLYNKLKLSNASDINESRLNNDMKGLIDTKKVTSVVDIHPQISFSQNVQPVSKQGNPWDRVNTYGKPHVPPRPLSCKKIFLENTEKVQIKVRTESHLSYPKSKPSINSYYCRKLALSSRDDAENVVSANSKVGSKSGVNSPHSIFQVYDYNQSNIASIESRLKGYSRCRVNTFEKSVDFSNVLKKHNGLNQSINNMEISSSCNSSKNLRPVFERSKSQPSMHINRKYNLFPYKENCEARTQSNANDSKLLTLINSSSKLSEQTFPMSRNGCVDEHSKETLNDFRILKNSYADMLSHYKSIEQINDIQQKSCKKLDELIGQHNSYGKESRALHHHLSKQLIISEGNAIHNAHTNILQTCNSFNTNNIIEKNSSIDINDPRITHSLCLPSTTHLDDKREQFTRAEIIHGSMTHRSNVDLDHRFPHETNENYSTTQEMYSSEQAPLVSARAHYGVQPADTGQNDDGHLSHRHQSIAKLTSTSTVNSKSKEELCRHDKRNRYNVMYKRNTQKSHSTGSLAGVFHELNELKYKTKSLGDIHSYILEHNTIKNSQSKLCIEHGIPQDNLNKNSEVINEPDTFNLYNNYNSKLSEDILCKPFTDLKNVEKFSHIFKAMTEPTSSVHCEENETQLSSLPSVISLSCDASNIICSPKYSFRESKGDLSSNRQNKNISHSQTPICYASESPCSIETYVTSNQEWSCGLPLAISSSKSCTPISCAIAPSCYALGSCSTAISSTEKHCERFNDHLMPSSTGESSYINSYINPKTKYNNSAHKSQYSNNIINLSTLNNLDGVHINYCDSHMERINALPLTNTVCSKLDSHYLSLSEISSGDSCKAGSDSPSSFQRRGLARQKPVRLRRRPPSITRQNDDVDDAVIDDTIVREKNVAEDDNITCKIAPAEEKFNFKRGNHTKTSYHKYNFLDENLATIKNKLQNNPFYVHDAFESNKNCMKSKENDRHSEKTVLKFAKIYSKSECYKLAKTLGFSSHERTNSRSCSEEVHLKQTDKVTNEILCPKDLNNFSELISNKIMKVYGFSDDIRNGLNSNNTEKSIEKCSVKFFLDDIASNFSTEDIPESLQPNKFSGDITLPCFVHIPIR